MVSQPQPDRAPDFDWESIDVILLDQGETFMFENDRFSTDEDYYATYRKVGGRTLSDTRVREVVASVVATLIEHYDSRKRDDTFPTVRDVVLSETDLDEDEAELIDDVVAEHEIGTISPLHRDTIHRLRRTHRLGIISNVFAQPPRFEHNLLQAGIFDCFEHFVWSSRHGAIKPSPRLFQVALDHWRLPADRVLYVGNDARRDVGGSKGVGMRSAWINLHGADLAEGLPAPDLTLGDLSELSVSERTEP